MVVDRFLGAGFASVHGPSDPHAVLLWTLDHGFAGLLPAPSPRPVDWRGLHRSVGKLPFRFGGVRVSALQGIEPPVESGLSSSRDGDRQAALSAVADRVAFAMDLGCGRIILEPGMVRVAGAVNGSDLGDSAAKWTPDRAADLWTRRTGRRDAALDAACRSLHELCRRFPDVEFCLTLSRNVLGLGEPNALAAVFEDLVRYRIGYWHDTSAAACREEFLGEDPGQILEERSKDMIGMTLGDFGDGDCYLPPGAGGVDYSLLSAYRQPSASHFPVVIELDPGVDPGEIRGVHAYLDKFGL